MTEKVIRIYGTAFNLNQVPSPSPGTEIWLANWHHGYNQRHPRVIEKNEWTRYFNLHSRAHMDKTYPSGVAWYKSHDGSRPIYFQKHQPDIPGSTVFPRAEIEAFFPEAIGPTGKFYTTCSVCWEIPFAIMQDPKRIELWGFALSDRKPRDAYLFERPCFFYWVKQAQDRGIEVTYQKEVHDLPFICGDPSTYTGTVYGYETKPEE
jgi:hypothetical protein